MEYISRPYDDSYTASILKLFGKNFAERIRLSNCSITIVTIEWNLGGNNDDYLCKSKTDEINIINHIQS